MQPIPVTNEAPQGTVVNMINTTTTLEKTSHAVNPGEVNILPPTM